VGCAPPGLTIRETVAIDRRHQDGAVCRFGDTFRVKDVKIPSRIPQNLLQAALGHRNTGEVGDGFDRFVEGALYCRLDQAPL